MRRVFEVLGAEDEDLVLVEQAAHLLHPGGRQTAEFDVVDDRAEGRTEGSTRRLMAQR